MSSYASVEQALGWLAAETGKDVTRNREELLTVLNDARALLYTIYQRVRLDFYIEGCVAVQEFCQPCLSCSDTPATYLGISLPAEIEQVETLFAGTCPVPLYDKWVEYRTYIRGSGGCLKGIDMGGDYPIQGDIDCGKCAKLKFTAIAQEDCGKIITVRYRDNGYEERQEHIKLAMEGLCIEAQASSLARPGGIVLPTGMKGGVIVQNAVDGRCLGRLSPRLTVPSFRRMKLTGICAGSHVAFRATRKFTEVFWDWEVIELGGEGKLALLEAYRYNKNNGVNSADPAWIQKSKIHLDNVTQYIAGANMRSDGATGIKRINLRHGAGSTRSRLNAGKR